MNLNKWLLAGYLSVLGFLSLNPWVRPSSAPALGNVAWDSLDHAIAYAGLCVLTLLALRKMLAGWAGMAVAILFVLGVGVFYEYCQHWFTENRSFSYADIYADGLGGMLGAALFWGFDKVSGRVLERGRP